ncbi:MAG: hypothetical protein ALECFALPRED_009206 [Alectoria fallacina]|uniref:Uncharacterized protein n=1 Tax=Alectoria fallacina TaxID=1903189 RepID=A0A8H3F124_9LECA|nr:MAG: hypothetical protein ALECFALPRED_009206 [Alectoria fallacina]
MVPTLSTLRGKLCFTGRAGVWKFLALIVALLNLKSLPFVWHNRLLKGLFTHLRTSRLRLATTPGPSTLFQSLITSSRSGFLECDYNLHKSNSTYFSDFDVGRLELLVSLCTHGIEETRKELALEEKDGRGEGAMGKGRFEIRLGAVSCQFRKEIKPYEEFERKGRQHKDNEGESIGLVNGNANENATPSPHPAIFASGIAKYVFKKGRLTIPPERVLRASKLLPPKSAHHETPPATFTPNPESTSNTAAAVSFVDQITPGNAEDVVDASLKANVTNDDGEWTWEKVEEERKRGMKIAEMWAALEGSNGEFSGDGGVVLGRY